MSQWISEDRFLQMMQGTSVLARFVDQWIQSGIGTDPKLFAIRLDEMAERLIDYKCSSLARRFRVLSNSIRNDATEWIQDCAHMLSELYYCTQQVKCVKYDNSDEFLDYWIWLGLPIKKEEVFKGKCILDDWVVLGQISEKEETLRVLKTFFYGKTSKKIGVLYEYMVAFQETSFKWTLGKHYSCSMYFYPGKMNFRIINDNVSAEKYDRWPENSSIDLKDTKAYIMQQMLDFPLTSFIPLILKANRITKNKKDYFLVDAEDSIKLSILSSQVTSKIKILNSGEAFDVFGIYESGGFLPLSMNYRGEFHSLQVNDKKIG